MSLKPVCVPCQRFFRPKRNGFAFIEGMPVENGAQPGQLEPEKWRPYKLWNGDRWECPDCGASIVVGVMGPPVAEHYQKDFVSLVKMYGGDQLQVNDC
jgi:hypothetical protein